MVLSSGYFALLMMSAAREDSPVMDRACVAIMHYLQRLTEDEKDAILLEIYKAVLTAYRDDDASYLRDSLVLSKTMDLLALLWILFLSERGLATSEQVLEIAFQRQLYLKRFFKVTFDIVLALKNDDNEQLSKAIDEAEAAQMVVHAARMRIVLAQRTGDRSQLEHARVVLECIQDRRFLRRLEEVAGVIS